MKKLNSSLGVGLLLFCLVKAYFLGMGFIVLIENDHPVLAIGCLLWAYVIVDIGINRFFRPEKDRMVDFLLGGFAGAFILGAIL